MNQFTIFGQGSRAAEDNECHETARKRRPESQEWDEEDKWCARCKEKPSFGHAFCYECQNDRSWTTFEPTRPRKRDEAEDQNEDGHEGRESGTKPRKKPTFQPRRPECQYDYGHEGRESEAKPTRRPTFQPRRPEGQYDESPEKASGSQATTDKSRRKPLFIQL